LENAESTRDLFGLVCFFMERLVSEEVAIRNFLLSR
jgi:hypothetical protein